MKIGIITCHCPHNYGAVLQTYALQYYLELQGVNVEIIDYRPFYLTNSHTLWYIGNDKFRKNPILRIIYLSCFFYYRLRRIRNFSNFINSELKCSSIHYLNFDEIKKNPPIADQFICGSDQIWNTKLPNGWDESYYLSFVKDNSKKNSYAASMAIDSSIKLQDIEFITTRIKSFNSLSVREDVAVDILQPHLEKPLKCVIDPVFLLSRNQWENFISGKKLAEISQDYILVYPMGDPENVIKVAEYFSKLTDCPIFMISNSLKKHSAVKKQYNGCSPYMFLYLIKNAKYVVTNSFHGTSFSIIFQKNFWACNIENTNSRITSLLRLAQLEDRYLNEKSTLEVLDLTRTIDYSRSEARLLEKIKESKLFLKMIYECK